VVLTCRAYSPPASPGGPKVCGPGVQRVRSLGPGFVEAGDLVVVNTKTGEFVRRVR